MWYKLGKLLNNILFLWVIALAVNIITFIVIYTQIHPSSATLALHFNVLSGVDIYGSGKEMYYVPATGFLIIVVNFILFRATYEEFRFLGYLSAFSAGAVQIFMLIAVLFLKHIN
ncbi:MAG TPA: hypothetical protein VHA30_04435 [Patescibacteria group bacterium]|nr:hypothetical protein [Patescibacteria group bacterium]